MSGGYISCGEFLGDDKSGSAITGVLEALPECLPKDQRDEFLQDILTPLTEPLEDGSDYIEIPPDIASILLPPVETLYSQYGIELGAPEPWEAPQIDEDRKIDSIDAKWGKGIGWRYYCLHDLKIALQTSIKTGNPVIIHFD